MLCGKRNFLEVCPILRVICKVFIYNKDGLGIHNHTYSM